MCLLLQTEGNSLQKVMFIALSAVKNLQQDDGSIAKISGLCQPDLKDFLCIIFHGLPDLVLGQVICQEHLIFEGLGRHLLDNYHQHHIIRLGEDKHILYFLKRTLC